MAHITAERIHSSLFDRLRGTLAGWSKEIERHRVFKQTYGELSSLSDRELADIGVARFQIVDLAWDSAQRV